ncbi:MAG: globin [Spirochaetota bacterium]
MFRIDEMNLYERLGLDTIKTLSRTFYTKVYQDKDPSFRGMFPDNMEMAIQNQYEFFAQRLGGPPLYSSRKGHPALRARHAHFSITRQHAERWLGYMRKAMLEVGIPDDARAALDEFFTDTAYFRQNVDDEGERIY